MKRVWATTAIAAGALCLYSLSAFAGPQSPPPLPTCDVSDVTLDIGTSPLVAYHPSVCVSNLQVNDNNSSADHERDLMNTAFKLLDPTLTNYTTVGRDEISNTPSVLTLDGIQFTMTTPSIGDKPTGSFTLSWVDTNGTVQDNLPISIGFELLLNGGSNSDAYRFVNVILPNSPNNTGSADFKLAFFNSSGKNVPDLSHITLTAGNDVSISQQCTTGTCTTVPEPASFGLLGLGVLGTIFVASRRR